MTGYRIMETGVVAPNNLPPEALLHRQLNKSPA